jgi:hypothetical protein
MTSVVLGDDAPEGGWGEGDCDCAIVAAESRNITKGNRSFIALISIQYEHGGHQGRGEMRQAAAAVRKALAKRLAFISMPLTVHRSES